MRTLKVAVLACLRAAGMFALMRTLTRGKLRVLCYHAGSLGDEWRYNGKLFCRRATFERRMKWLARKRFDVVDLSRALASPVRAGLGLQPQVAITFDDGWLSTGSELLPVLFAYGWPSTLYLSTKLFLEGRPVASVLVRYMVWRCRHDRVTLDGFGPELDGSHDLRAARPRNRLIERLVRLLEGASSAEEARAIVSHVAAVMGIGEDELMLSTGRFGYMDAATIKAVAAMGCAIELHGHAHHYPAGNPELFESDLRACRQVIMELGLPEPTHYCYPSGSFDPEASAVLSRVGVLSAATCIPGLVDTAEAHPHYLPRFLDGDDVHQLEFEAEMSGVMDLLRRAMRRLKRSPQPEYVLSPN